MSSKLIVDQKNVKYLFQDKKATFLIPDYQHPYAWGEDECKVLWEICFHSHSQTKILDKDLDFPK